MKRYTLLLLFCTFLLQASAQISYTEFKEKFPLTCTRFDSASVIEAQHLLDSLNQYEVSEGRDRFLYDYGMTYYFRWGKWKQQDDLDQSIKCFQEGYDAYQGSGFAWQLAFLYKQDHQCDRALDYARLYARHSKEEEIEIRYQQLYYIYRDCCGAEADL